MLGMDLPHNQLQGNLWRKILPPNVSKYFPFEFSENLRGKGREQPLVSWYWVSLRSCTSVRPQRVGAPAGLVEAPYSSGEQSELYGLVDISSHPWSTVAIRT